MAILCNLVVSVIIHTTRQWMYWYVAQGQKYNVSLVFQVKQLLHQNTSAHSPIINGRCKFLAQSLRPCWVLGGIPPSITVWGVTLAAVRLKAHKPSLCAGCACFKTEPRSYWVNTGADLSTCRQQADTSIVWINSTGGRPYGNGCGLVSVVPSAELSAYTTQLRYSMTNWYQNTIAHQADNRVAFEGSV